MPSSREFPAHVDRAATLDRLARRALERLAPLEFGLAETPAERDAVLRMRYECVVAEGWSRPEDMPEGRERDDYDDDAAFIVCRDGGTLVGSMRMVAPAPDRPLPTEREFGVRVRPAGSVFEVGRLVVAKAGPGGHSRSHLVIGGMAAQGWLAACVQGFDRALSTATPELIDLYQALGLHVMVLGPAKLHWGAMRAPVLIDGDEHSFDFLTRPEAIAPDYGVPPGHRGDA